MLRGNSPYSSPRNLFNRYSRNINSLSSHYTSSLSSRNINSRSSHYTISRLCSSTNHSRNISSHRSNPRKQNRRRKGAYRLP